MSAYADAKQDFLRQAGQNGWFSLSEIPETWKQTAPEHILQRWLSQINSPVRLADFSRPKRLLNHFSIGADPEFVFMSPRAEERIDAMNLGFKAAVAWGADNNGRLCEIRPAPSRYALEVGASIWSTLVWMSKFHPASLDYAWKSGAWVAGDGVGGHVHFGRKRPTWQREVAALDTLAFWLQHINIFNQAEWRERIRRTRGRGNYGQLSDRRIQAHGWEYRTIPSWLDSPWLAYCVLTLSKLAVFDPEFLPQLSLESGEQSAQSVRTRLRAMLAYYKGRDDDAAIAHQILLRNGWPHFEQADFKQRWGIFGRPPSQTEISTPSFTIPSMIPSTPELTQEFGQALLENRTPEWLEVAPTWTPNTLPSGYVQALNYVETFHHPGLGELVRDLVWHSSQPQRIAASSNSRLEICSHFVGEKQLTKFRKQFPDITLATYTPESTKSETWRIFLPTGEVNDPKIRRQIIGFLVSGLFPIWHISEVKADSLQLWQAKQSAEKAVVKAAKRAKTEDSKLIWSPKMAEKPGKTPPKPEVPRTGVQFHYIPSIGDLYASFTLPPGAVQVTEPQPPAPSDPEFQTAGFITDVEPDPFDQSQVIRRIVRRRP